MRCRRFGLVAPGGCGRMVIEGRATPILPAAVGMGVVQDGGVQAESAEYLPVTFVGLAFRCEWVEVRDGLEREMRPRCRAWASSVPWCGSFN